MKLTVVVFIFVNSSTAKFNDMETNLIGLEAKLQMTSGESRTPIGRVTALTNGSPAST